MPLVVRQVHFIGLGGIGQRGLAHVLAERGLVVTGSDAASGPYVERLTACGVKFLGAAAARDIHAGMDLVIRSAAVSDDHPEVRAARTLDLPVIKYAQALALVMQGRKSIAVAGTHGKTTSTAMIAWTLQQAGMSPGHLIGGEVISWPHNGCDGQGQCFVAEACEYDRSFLQLQPDLAVITNVEPDHLDCYRDLDEIREAFAAFAARVAAGGVILLGGGDERVRALIRRTGRSIECFGPTSAPEILDDQPWDLTSTGPQRLVVQHHGRAVAVIALRVPGQHNRINALGAAAALRHLGLTWDAIAQGLSTFPGVRRRFQILCERQDRIVVDDYAHHPTAVAAVARTARERFPGRKLVAVYQPHQYSRTRHFLQGFAEALAAYDEIIIPGIYASRDREEDRQAIGPEHLVWALARRGAQALQVNGREEAEALLQGPAYRGAAVIVMGAGDIGALATRLAE